MFVVVVFVVVVVVVVVVIVVIAAVGVVVVINPLGFRLSFGSNIPLSSLGILFFT